MAKQLELDLKVKGEFPYTDEASYRRDLIKDVRRQRTLPNHLRHLSNTKRNRYNLNHDRQYFNIHFSNL